MSKDKKIGMAGGLLTLLAFISLAGMLAVPSTPIQVPQVQGVETISEIPEQAEPTVEEKTETKTKSIPYETTKQNTSSLNSGTTKVSVTGANGVKTITYKVTYTDSIETAREKTSEKIITQPVTKVILVGTYVAPKKVATSSILVKKSDSDICHAPGTTYYDRTLYYIAYPSLQACLDSGGRLPKR